MQTIENIRFNDNIYKDATYWTFLLYQNNEVRVAIPLPDAPLMSFIRDFDNITQCQHHIDTNLQRMITLFAYDDDIQQWLGNITDIPPNLREIKIFCASDDHSFVTDWSRRFIQRFKNTTFDIITFEELNTKLLLFGADYLQKLRRDFPPGSQELQQATRDYKRICHALANHFWKEANN